jgi:hypothetical protein
VLTILCTSETSHYYQYEVETYGKEQDAATYTGNNGHAIIAHPPCAQWGRLRALSKDIPYNKSLALIALRLIRQNGGVLEHPIGSTLFKKYCRKAYSSPGRRDRYGGFIYTIDLSWFGHPSRKRTQLYIVGLDSRSLPTFPYNIQNTHKSIENLSKKHRENTPESLCTWLINIGQLIYENQRWCNNVRLTTTNAPSTTNGRKNI